MAVYGYARVSTDGQSLTAQLAELKAAKCEKIFQEKISGVRSDRKQLTRLMAVLAKGDVLVVTRLDRLARSTRDLLNLLGTLAVKGAGRTFSGGAETGAEEQCREGRCWRGGRRGGRRVRRTAEVVARLRRAGHQAGRAAGVQAFRIPPRQRSNLPVSRTRTARASGDHARPDRKS